MNRQKEQIEVRAFGVLNIPFDQAFVLFIESTEGDQFEFALSVDSLRLLAELAGSVY